MRTTVFTVVLAAATLASRARAAGAFSSDDAILLEARALQAATVPDCSEGLTWSDQMAACVDLRSDANNCGAVGHVCFDGQLNDGVAQCVASQCTATCNPGLAFEASVNKCLNLSTDPHNCGAVGLMCGRPVFGLATCEAGACSFVCQKGYVMDPLDNTKCHRENAGPERKKKRRGKQTTYQLCPLSSETACPIAGSASLSSQLARRLPSLKEVDQLILPRGKGGYECLDLTLSIESCGGCSSLGEGQDCTAIAHSAGVGCENSQCVVFSCNKGYQPSLNSATCVKTQQRHGRRKKQKRNLHAGVHSHDR